MAETKTTSTTSSTPTIQDETPSQPVADVLGLVPEATRDNYVQIARDAAAATGRTVKSCLAEMARGWEDQHKDDPTGGWNYLAQWAKTADLHDDDGPTALELATARQIESARRDPSFGLAGQPAVVDAAVQALEAPAAAVAGVGTDAASGVVANPGTVSVDNPTQD